jgi:hypothetical protein
MTQQHFPLSIQTLKMMKKRANGSTGKVMGTVDEYFIELSNSISSPKSNLEMSRLAREIFPNDGRAFKTQKAKRPTLPISANTDFTNNVRTIPSWSTKLASRG